MVLSVGRSARSPLIHNHWLAAHIIKAHYERCPIDPAADFRAALNGLAADGFIGANVTIPHKENAFAAMDSVDAAAQKVGAVNAITFRDGALHVNNTDGAGFVTGLKASHADKGQGHDWAAHPTLVLGAGGAARAIIVALHEAGVPQIRLVNRTEASRRPTGPIVSPVRRCLGGAGRIGRRMPALVNQPWHAGRGGADMPLDHMPQTALVSDIVYTPLETDLLVRARATGLVWWMGWACCCIRRHWLLRLGLACARR